MKAKAKGRLLRQKYGYTGRVDVHDLADRMGLRIDERDLPPEHLHEITVRGNIAVSTRVTRPERRWAIAHGIAHRILHPGNHVWLRAHTLLAIPFEREAEELTFGLLVDEAEVWSTRLGNLPEVAAYFGVPTNLVRKHGPEVWGQVRLF